MPDELKSTVRGTQQEQQLAAMELDAKLLQRYQAGERVPALAAEFGVTEPRIYQRLHRARNPPELRAPARPKLSAEEHRAAARKPAIDEWRARCNHVWGRWPVYGREPLEGCGNCGLPRPLSDLPPLAPLGLYR